MDFKQIEAFVNVVRYKSFSKAADAMFFTQPTISTHISNLESQLGVKLLDRRGRNVEMTPQGVIFYKYAIEMINSRSRAIEALDVGEGSINGIIEIQTSSIPGVAFLPELLAEFRKDNNKIQYFVSMSSTGNVIDNILNRQGEIGFVGRRDNRRDPNGELEYIKIFQDSSVLIAPTSMELPSEITFEEAITYPLLWRESSSATRTSFEDVATSLGLDKSTFEVAGLFSDIGSIVRSVAAGLGVSIISRKAAEAIKNDKISIIEISNFSDDRDFYLISLRNAVLSPAALAFKNFAIERAEL